MQGILSLFRSRKFWLAMVGIAQTVLFNLIPDFPPEIWEAINVLLLVLIATYAWEDAAAKRTAGTIELAKRTAGTIELIDTKIDTKIDTEEEPKG